MKTRYINKIQIDNKNIPYKWMEELVSNGKIGGVMLVYVEGFTEKEIKYKTKEIKQFCEKLKKGGNMTFQYVSPTEDQIKAMQIFRDKYEALAKELEMSVDKSRGLSLALTKLEESSMWLNKAITKND